MKIKLKKEPFAYTKHFHGIADVGGIAIEFNMCVTYDSNVSGYAEVEDVILLNSIPPGSLYTEEQVIKSIREHFNYV